MKFVHVKIPVSVEHYGPFSQNIEKTELGVLEVTMFVGLNATTEEVLQRLGERLRDRLHTVDLGDDS